MDLSKINNKIIRKAKLDNGQIVEYDLAQSNTNPPRFKNFTYLGCGVIYSIRGIEQLGDKKFHFYKKT